jgi:hypothetical protein
LQRAQLTDAAGGKVQQRIEFMAAKRVAFGRALHLDEGAAVIHHDIHIGFADDLIKQGVDYMVSLAQ